MRMMLMHKNDPKTEAGELPSAKLIQEMGAFMGEFMSTGRFIDGAGLSGSKTRTRLIFREGKSAVRHGPYRGERELPAAMLVLKVKTREEAIGWAERYGKILHDGEIELGKINEPWDLGMMPAPPDPPLSFLLIDKADAATEGAGRSSKQKADLTRLKTEMSKAGVLVKTFTLEPSSKAKRLLFVDNDARVLDGPFPETKELIGGFAILELAGTDEAIALCRRYAAILGGTLEIDLRLLAPEEPVT